MSISVVVPRYAGRVPTKSTPGANPAEEKKAPPAAPKEKPPHPPTPGGHPPVPDSGRVPTISQLE